MTARIQMCIFELKMDGRFFFVRLTLLCNVERYVNSRTVGSESRVLKDLMNETYS